MLSNFLSFFFSSFSYHLVHYTGTGKLWKSRYVCSPKKTSIPREGFGDFGFVKISLYRKVILFFTSSFFMLIMEWILSFAIVIRKITDYMLRDI